MALLNTFSAVVGVLVERRHQQWQGSNQKIVALQVPSTIEIPAKAENISGSQRLPIIDTSKCRLRLNTFWNWVF